MKSLPGRKTGSPSKQRDLQHRTVQVERQHEWMKMQSSAIEVEMGVQTPR
jgi:hypothetical protein